MGAPDAQTPLTHVRIVVEGCRSCEGKFKYKPNKIEYIVLRECLAVGVSGLLISASYVLHQELQRCYRGAWLGRLHMRLTSQERWR